MRDLEIAKQRLKEKSLTLSIVKNTEVIFESVSQGITGFLEAIEKFGDKLKGASVADRVAGKAIALLCVYAKVKAVYTVTSSKRAKTVFEKHSIHHELDRLVESILDINKVGICPFEKLATEISDPAEAYERLKTLQFSLSLR
jgi:hypothetical protein